MSFKNGGCLKPRVKLLCRRLINLICRNKKIFAQTLKMEKIEDDFEYHLVFPSPTGDKPNDKKSEVNTLNIRDPVVILLGWAGCKDNHLAKYSAIHEDNGYAVIRYTAPVKILFKHGCIKKLTSHAEKLVNLLYDYDLNSHPIFFHVFSNGGACMFDQVSKILEKEEHSKIKVRGCMFDSSPAQMTPTRTFHAVWAMVPGNIFKRVAMSIATTIYLWTSWAINRIAHFVSGRINEPHRWAVYYRLGVRPVVCPELFLYSKADLVTEYSSVNAFVGERASRGAKVTAKLWEDSPHVGHLKSHRESYIETVATFIKECLKTKEE